VTRKKKPCPRMNADELRDFVLAYCDGSIWTNLDALQPRDVGLMFLPVAFAPHLIDLEGLGLIWADVRKDDKFPTGINGRPMFGSCRVMHKDDWSRAREAIKRELDRRKTIDV